MHPTAHAPRYFTCPAATFDAAERLVIETARAWFVHKAPSYLFESRLVKALGADRADPIQAPFHAVMTSLFLHARRQLRIHPPGCPRISADERAVLGLFAAAAIADGPGLAARLTWLMPPKGHGVVAVSTERVTRILVRAGYVFATCPPLRNTRSTIESALENQGITPLRLLG